MRGPDRVHPRHRGEQGGDRDNRCVRRDPYARCACSCPTGVHNDLGPARREEHTYRIAGPSCLAGDVVGDYSFDRALERGDRLVFTDMASITIVKSTTFNGMNLPDIAVIRDGAAAVVVKRFGYDEL